MAMDTKYTFHVAIAEQHVPEPEEEKILLEHKSTTYNKPTAGLHF